MKKTLPLILTIVTIGSLVLAGCSLISPASRPDPAAENVRCLLEYQPVASGEKGPDLLFLAWSSPFKEETFYMSLPDGLFHSVFAPGRHLWKGLRVEGVGCSQPPWRKGAILPRRPGGGKFMVCTRQELDAVLFEVETKWGTCRAEIPANDRSPRPIDARRRELWKLPPLGRLTP